MRVTLYGKLFFFLTLSVLLLFLYISLRDISQNSKIKFGRDISVINNITILKDKNIEEIINVVNNEVNRKKIKYILQWTSPRNVPFVYMGNGQQGFVDRKCEYTNCFVTSNKTLLGKYTEFDVIAFAGPEVVWMDYRVLPMERSPHQKFVFASIESSDYYPVCSSKLDNFFNWTWTFRLDSESRWGYIVIRDLNGKIIGPEKEMHWMKLEDMIPITEEMKSSFRKKSKAAAWFVSNCFSRSHREDFAEKLNKELRKYKLGVDIYGKCGSLVCSRDNEEKCDEMIKNDYYFYLSFENSFSEDYVTEKLLHSLNYNAIPIVYGGANYTRFMPDGIYLNARELGPKNLAAKMNELIQDIDKYSEYFRWKNHYKYHKRAVTVETDDYCGFCHLLNQEEKVKETTVYKNFREWWDPPNRC